MFLVEQFATPADAQTWLNERTAEGWLIVYASAGPGVIWLILKNEP